MCEEFDYQSYKGVISWIRLSEDGLPEAREVAIEMPSHMSYPCLFEWRGDVYCVPETYRAREIGLYRADRFPASWTKAATLVRNFAGVDSTVFFYQGNWWITCTDQDWGPDEGLFLWHARELTGPWHPHPQNPVKKGRNGTRPAGTPFTHKGELFRPAMDSSKTYGERIVLNRVKRLTPTEFEEYPACVIEPFRHGRYRYGLHTLSQVGRWTLVDGLAVIFEKSEFKRAWEHEARRVSRFLIPLLHRS